MKTIGCSLFLLAVLAFAPVIAQQDPSEPYAVSDPLEDFGLFTRDDIF